MGTNKDNDRISDSAVQKSYFSQRGDKLAIFSFSILSSKRREKKEEKKRREKKKRKKEEKKRREKKKRKKEETCGLI